MRLDRYTKKAPGRSEASRGQQRRNPRASEPSGRSDGIQMHRARKRARDLCPFKKDLGPIKKGSMVRRPVARTSLNSERQETAAQRAVSPEVSLTMTPSYQSFSSARSLSAMRHCWRVHKAAQTDACQRAISGVADGQNNALLPVDVGGPSSGDRGSISIVLGGGCA
jgi:hypothetical protein